MKWNYEYPKDGDLRTKKRFLIAPVCLGGECRWLESAQVVERWQPRSNEWGAFFRWTAIKWSDGIEVSDD